MVAAKTQPKGRKGTKRVATSEGSASDNGSNSKTPAKKQPVANKGKKRAVASQGGKAKKR